MELDGQLLSSDWEWAGFQKCPTEKGLEVVVSLRHALRRVSLKVHTLLDGTPVLARWLEVTNGGDRPAALAACYPWSGVLQKTQRWKSHLADTGKALVSVGYFDSDRAISEGDFHWHDLPEAGYRVDGRYRRISTATPGSCCETTPPASTSSGSSPGPGG